LDFWGIATIFLFIYFTRVVPSGVFRKTEWGEVEKSGAWRRRRPQPVTSRITH